MRISTLWRVIVLVLLSVTGWSSVLAADKMVLGAGLDPSHGALYVGIEAGIFKKHNIDAELKLFPTGAASTPYLISGDVQVSLAGPPAGILAHARAPQVVMVGQGSGVHSDWYAAVAESGIKDVPGLRGKKVGVNLGAGSETFTTEVLKKYGMTLKDIAVVNLDLPEMLAGLERGDIVAFFAWDPWITRAQLALGNRVHLLEGTTNYFKGQNHLYMNRAWIERNEDLALRFLRAFKESNEFINANPAMAAEMVSKTLKIEQTIVERMLPKFDYVLVLNQDTMTFLQSDVEKQIAANRLNAPFDYKGYVYPDLLRKLDPSLVNYQLPR
jgi:ABC-type nitrate/sulfonate/bicarbonate transport system substrate-binding protein